jgi:hypothetical protein
MLRFNFAEITTHDFPASTSSRKRHLPGHDSSRVPRPLGNIHSAFRYLAVAELPRGKASVACDLAHISAALFRRRLRETEDRPMPQRRTPHWLQIDLLIIVISVGIIGIVAWIAP